MIRLTLTYDGAYVDVSFDGLPGGGFSEDDVFEGCSGEGHDYGGGEDELVTLVLVCWKKKIKREVIVVAATTDFWCVTVALIMHLWRKCGEIPRVDSL